MSLLMTSIAIETYPITFAPLPRLLWFVMKEESAEKYCRIPLYCHRDASVAKDFVSNGLWLWLLGSVINREERGKPKHRPKTYTHCFLSSNIWVPQIGGEGEGIVRFASSLPSNDASLSFKNTVNSMKMSGCH